MTDLRKEARGRECMVRTDVCNHDVSTTVLAHLRQIGMSGMGHKSPDIFGAWACYACHTLCDTGWFQGVELMREERTRYLDEGFKRTLAVLVKEGKVKW